MVTKFVRVFAALFIGLGFFGTGGSVRASEAALPDLTISPASSLGVQFLVVANSGNTVSNEVIIDYPLINNQPNAIIIVTPDWDPGNIGGTYDNHPIGVYYSSGKWRIFHQDLAAVALGDAFNVIVPTAGAGVFVHTSAGVGPTGSTELDNSLTNNNPNARILVTANWNPGGVGGTYNNHSIGVWYYDTDQKWTIINQDGAAVPVGAAFNVFVLPANVGTFVQTSSLSNNILNSTEIDHPLTDHRPDALVFVTPNRSPAGVGGPTYNHNYGVWTDGVHWFIFNEDSATMPVNVSFNVLVLDLRAVYFVHRATGANTIGDDSYIDNALANGHPNALVFTTSNYNPGGVGGTYNNHNIGVYFSDAINQWAVFNQDTAAIPLNNAFNVVVPRPDASVFVQKAAAGNTVDQYTILDYPLTNGDPNALVFVTPNWNPGGGGGTINNHPTGVYYTGGKWRIANEDDALMPLTASFNVFVPPAGPNAFVQTASLTNSIGNSTYIDNSLTNLNPHAILLVTPNFNPGEGGFALYNNHPIGVWYDTLRGQWAIFNQDMATMPVFASFNVYVYGNYQAYLPLIKK